jgi:Polyketide cyclase / dehydrase and lipid transport
MSSFVFRLSLGILLLSLLATGLIYGEEWREVGKNPSLTIYARHRSGSTLEELRAVGELDAPATKVETVLADVSKYPEFMPYMKESRPLTSDDQLCYVLLNPPIVGERDCTIRVHLESRKRENGATAYYWHWELANAEGPAPRPGVNRVNINEGSWLLEPMGNRTTATHILYTDGGGIPAFLANIVNKQCIAQLFDALRVRVLGPVTNQSRNDGTFSGTR